MTYAELKQITYEYLINRMYITEITLFYHPEVACILISGLAEILYRHEKTQELCENDLEIIIQEGTSRPVYCIKYARTILDLAHTLSREASIDGRDGKYQYMCILSVLQFYEIIQAPEIEVIIKLQEL